jgi:hypothetical protein
MGVPIDDARRLAHLPLPPTPQSDIDFSFAIEDYEAV